MNPAADHQLAGPVIIVTFVVIAVLLLGLLIRSTLWQQRRYARVRAHFGGRLLAAQDEERASIARELHDDTVQRLIACTARLRASDSPVATSIAADLDWIVESVRGLARGMHPAIVDHAGLDAALADLCAACAEREDLMVSFTGTGSQQHLARGQQLALFRVVQEALGNMVRHAGAKVARVTLTSDTHLTTLVIEDDGVGFDDNVAEAGPGIGITSMRERMTILGGSLRIQSTPGEGTRVVATLSHPDDAS